MLKQLSLLLLLATASFGQSVRDVESGFARPPASAKPHTWWHWMNGNVTADGITKDLEAMAQAGLGGAQMFHVTDRIPPGPVGYDLPAWHALVRHTIREADRVGLEICFHNCAGWSSSGGPWITPEQSMKTVVCSETRVAGGTAFDGVLPQPPSKHDYYVDIATLAIPTPASERAGGPKAAWRLADWQNKAGYARNNRPPVDDRPLPLGEAISLEAVIDLSDQMKPDGHLTWPAPAGDWTILRFGYTTTGKTNAPAPDEGRGLECDKLSRAGAEAHWRGIVDKVLADAGPLAGKTLNNVLIDSYEVGAQNWTQGFETNFRDRWGYDLGRFLPCLTGRVVGNVEVTERFLWDFRRLIAERFASEYFGHMAELCHQHGLALSVEPYGRPGNFDDYLVASTADIPMGEFWVNRTDAWHWWSVKLAASNAHAMGKRVVGAETFTAGGKSAAWVNHPRSLKQLGDYFFAHGLNRMIFHDYAHHPTDDRPGQTMGPHGFQMNRGNTWFAESTAWLTYLARCQYLLQEGRFVADLLYYGGELSPNTLVRREEMVPTPPEGYDYDAVGTDLLMRLTVEDGLLALPSGMRYRVMVLPHDDTTMRPEVLRKLRELVLAGATIVGPRPTSSPSLRDYPACDDEVAGIADELWSDLDGTTQAQVSAGRGRVIWGQPLERAIGVPPDVAVEGDAKLVWLHRRLDDADVYFVANQDERYVTADVTFRVTGRTPELWRPVDGSHAPAVWRAEGDQTTVTLPLGPTESLFVIFRDGPGSAVSAVTRDGQNALLPGGGPTPKLVIVRAIYGVMNNPQQQVDITKILQDKVQGGALTFVANNTLAGDPARQVRKAVRVIYELDGVRETVNAPEGQTVTIGQSFGRGSPPAARLAASGLLVREPGQYEVMAGGKPQTIAVEAVPEPQTLTGPWTVSFPPNLGAPAEATFAELTSWSESEEPGIRYFSGTGTYQLTFDVPAAMLADDHVLTLDLGEVEVMARVTLNGEDLGLLWTRPYAVDVTGKLKPSGNELAVAVTNLWPNRIIGDTRLPEGQRIAKTTWEHYKGNEPLLPSGLLGPVRVVCEVKRSL